MIFLLSMIAVTMAAKTRVVLNVSNQPTEKYKTLIKEYFNNATPEIIESVADTVYHAWAQRPKLGYKKGIDEYISRIHYDAKDFARATSDSHRDELKKRIMDSAEAVGVTLDRNILAQIYFKERLVKRRLEIIDQIHAWVAKMTEEGKVEKLNDTESAENFVYSVLHGLATAAEMVLDRIKTLPPTNSENVLQRSKIAIGYLERYNNGGTMSLKQLMALLTDFTSQSAHNYDKGDDFGKVDTSGKGLKNGPNKLLI